jgi:hypothetical protein
MKNVSGPLLPAAMVEAAHNTKAQPPLATISLFIMDRMIVAMTPQRNCPGG